MAGLAGVHRDERIEQIRFGHGRVSAAPRCARSRVACRGAQAAQGGTHTAALAGCAARHARSRTPLCWRLRVLPLDDDGARRSRLNGTATASERRRLHAQRDAVEPRADRAARRWGSTAPAAALPPDPVVYRRRCLSAPPFAEHLLPAIGPHCSICPLQPGCGFARSTTRT